MTHKLKKLEPSLLALIFWEKTTGASLRYLKKKEPREEPRET